MPTEPSESAHDEPPSTPVDQSMVSPVHLPHEPESTSKNASPSIQLNRPAKPWACDDCGESFRRPGALERHQRAVHSRGHDHSVERLRSRFGGASSTPFSRPSYSGHSQYGSSVSSYGRMPKGAEAIPEDATSSPSAMPIGSRRSPWPSNASHPSVVSTLNSVDSGYGSASLHPPSQFAKYAEWRPEPSSMSPSDSGNPLLTDFGASSPLSFPTLEALHIPEPMKHRYVCLLARLIAESVACYKPTPYVIDQICEALPDLLEQFALSIGGKHYSVMVALLKCKRYILPQNMYLSS